MKIKILTARFYILISDIPPVLTWKHYKSYLKVGCSLEL